MNLQAYFNTGLSGVLSGGGDTGEMYGAGFDFSVSPSSMYGIIYKGYYIVREDEREILGESINFDYSHYAHMGGIEFYIPVSFLEENRIKWKNSLCAGNSWTKVSANSSKGEATISDSGFAMLATTGLQYIMYQHFSPFVDMGYYYSQYNGELRKSNISGYQISCGVRYSFRGSKSISGEY